MPYSPHQCRTNSTKSLHSEIEDRERELGQLRLNLLRQQQQQQKQSGGVESFDYDDYGDGNPSDVLHLNVGGTRMDVLRRTLTSVEGSMLATKFSGRWDDSLEKDRDGNFFIDQPAELFLPLLNYLRARAIMTPNAAPVESPSITRDLHRVAEYYGLTHVIWPFGIFEYGNSKRRDEIIAMYPDYTVSSPDTTKTYQILPIIGNEEITIRSYEIKVGKGTSVLCIGWYLGTVKSDTFSNDVAIGYVDCSKAFDAIQCSVVASGKYRFDIENSNKYDAVQEDTIITIYDYGKYWYINGKRIEFPLGAGSMDYRLKGTPPTFSVKGEISIASLEINFDTSN